MTCNEQSKDTIPNHFKQLTCQATLCKYHKRPAICTADYLEMDDHGICIQFERKEMEPVTKIKSNNI